jgi:repressor LexA
MNGEIVAVLLEDEATVKRFFKKTASIKLMPENDFMEPIEVKDAQILGKVIGVIRKYF